MDEWIPILLSFCLGAWLPISIKRPRTLAIAIPGIVLIAATAFVASGESQLSWTYFLLDLAETSVGLLAGNAALRALRHARNLRKAN